MPVEYIGEICCLNNLIYSNAYALITQQLSSTTNGQQYQALPFLCGMRYVNAPLESKMLCLISPRFKVSHGVLRAP